MYIDENTIVHPLPSQTLIEDRERKWRVKLPESYKMFVMRYNGGIPDKRSFRLQDHDYAITRFLCLLQNTRESEYGWYDISVVESQISERLTDNEDLIGVEVLPIAELFAGDYVCLDFRNQSVQPCVCVWNHEESDDFEPVTYKVAANFSDFLGMLM